MNQFLVGESGTIGGIETALRIAQIDNWGDARTADGIVASLWWGQYHQRIGMRMDEGPTTEEIEFFELLQAEFDAGRILSSESERRRVEKAIDSYVHGTDVHCTELKL